MRVMIHCIDAAAGAKQDAETPETSANGSIWLRGVRALLRSGGKTGCTLLWRECGGE